MTTTDERARVVVIGAGPAGVTAAWALQRRGVHVELIEAGPAVGGLARSFELWGGRVDLGPHRFFSTDRRVNEAWLQATGDDYAMVDRTTRILYQGKLFDYPLRPGNALRNLGATTAVAAIGSYLQSRVRPPSDTSTFEGWVTSRFGRRLYEIFFKSYSEKLWGIPCTDLDADFAAQRIKGFSLGSAIASALRPSSGRRHKTLADRFAYPLGGSGTPYNNMVDAVVREGGSVRLNTAVRRVILGEDGAAQGVELADGSVLKAPCIVSSMPITQLIRGLPGVPEAVAAAAKELRFRNTLLVYLEIDGADLFPDQWVYVHDPRIQMGRLTNFSNWEPGLIGNPDRTILAAEYWANDDDPLWRADDEELIELATRDLHISGLITGRNVLRGHVERVHRCYPVYSRGYRTPLKAVENYLSSIPGLIAIGRYGAFKYNNQDHSILMGLMAADNITGSAAHDLWAVNTDYDDYQEEARIDETGLVSATSS